jgi:hypothetical protein
MAEWNMDHVVAEVWNAQEQRWRLIDAELPDGHVDPTDGAVLDPLDLPGNRFIVAPDAWLRCQEGEDDPDRYLVSPFLDIPGLQGWPYLLHNLVQDLAAINKHEMVLWDDWGISAEWASVTDDQRAMLDQTAQTMMSPETSVDDLQALFSRDEFRVPDTVISYTSAAENPPIDVRLKGVTV